MGLGPPLRIYPIVYMTPPQTQMAVFVLVTIDTSKKTKVPKILH